MRCAFSPCARMRACSVRRPRSVRKLSNGAPVTPMQLPHHFSLLVQFRPSPRSRRRRRRRCGRSGTWSSNARRASAPSASGCCQTGDRNVLSATTSAPAACAAAATAAMSTMRSSGLLGVSIQTSAGLLGQSPRRARPAPGSRRTAPRRAPRWLQRIEEPVRAAIAVVRHDGDLVRLEQLRHQRDGAHAGGGDDRARAAFEVGQRPAERVARRIARARVVVVRAFRRSR